MSVRMPTHRVPTHPGEMLLEEFLRPMGLIQRELAKAIRVPYQRINELVNGRRGITPSTALRLAKYFGMSADFWLNLQLRTIHGQRYEDYTAGVGGWHLLGSEAWEEKDGTCKPHAADRSSPVT